MTWVKIDDALNVNQKVRSVSLAARWSYISSICRAGATLSDGIIKRGDLSLVDANQKIARELELANLWEPRPEGWYIHDYLVYNRSREQIQKRSRTNSANGAKRSANGSANRSANGSPNRSANGSAISPAIRYEKQAENASDLLPQSARSAATRSIDPEEQREGSDSLSDSLSETDLAVGRLCRLWEQATNTTVPKLVGDRMADWLGRMPEAVIARAIAETGVSGSRAWRYTESILRRYETEGWEDKPAPNLIAQRQPNPEATLPGEMVLEMIRNRPAREAPDELEYLKTADPEAYEREFAFRRRRSAQTAEDAAP